MKKISALFMLAIFLSVFCAEAHAGQASTAILRQGLLGAGTGAVATAASGANGGAVWKGALVGMGVNVIGGALLDILTTSDNSQGVAYVTPVRLAAPQQIVIIRPAVQSRPYVSRSRRIYRAGYRRGYEKGYRNGYDDAVYDMRYF